MALDAFYKAIPEDSEMFRLAQHDRFYADCLPSIRSYVQMSRNGISEFLLQRVERVTELVSMANDMAQAHPGFEDRELFWGRHWDMIHYLLSPARRENRDPSTRHGEIIHKAIFGSTTLPLNAQSHILFVWANDVVEVADTLDSISVASLRPLVNVMDMQEKKVYKSSQMSTDDEEFEILKEDFVALRDFYRLVADNNEGVVTYLA